MTRDRVRQTELELNFMAGVRLVRQQKRLRQPEVGAVADISRQMMTHLETGRTRVTLEYAVSLQKALDTNIFDLIRIGQEHRERMKQLSKGIIA